MAPGATLRLLGTSGTSWTAWRDSLFVPVLAPKIEEAWSRAAASDLRGLIACDEALSQALPAEEQAASREAGLRLATQCGVPMLEKCWMRYLDRIVAGAVPANLAVVLALRAAVFHFPPVAALGSYVFLEVRAAGPELGVAGWMEAVADCLAAARNSSPALGLRAA